MATSITIAGLFGAESRVSFSGPNPRANFQDFVFPGLQDARFVTSLGRAGWTVSIRGLLRTAAGASVAAAADLFNTLVTTIENHQKLGTLLDLMAGDTTITKDLYRGTAATRWRGVVTQFALSGNRQSSKESATTFRIVQEFTATFDVLQIV
jgi:hypothetical protein